MTTARPPIASAEEWQRARDELLAAEKEATRALDALAARRRRLPMVEFSTDYEFDGPDGKRSLLELFEGRGELVVYQFMDNGPDQFCPGCTWFTNNIPPAALGLLANRGISWMTVSNMPLAQMEGYWTKMGWMVPFASSRGNSFSADCGGEGHEHSSGLRAGGFMLSVFLREGRQVYRTYNTTSRGVDRLLFAWNIMDLTPYGRMEDWEDSPPGWPQHPTYG